jgi:4-phytase / acid phosphatase
MPVSFRLAAATFAFALSALCASPAVADGVTFDVVVARHGVRSLTKPPMQYAWPDWNPVSAGFLTARGYKLMTYMGAFYRSYFASEGLTMCGPARSSYVYADNEQRPYETARAIVEGACGAPDAVATYHDALAGAADPLFDGSDYFGPAGKIDTPASLAAVTAAAPSPPSAIVTDHVADFAALQAVLDGRCPSVCTPAHVGTSEISATKNLAELGGPIDVASGYAEALFLEYAQCRPLAQINGGDATVLATRLEGAMRLHVLAYDGNARNPYNSLVRGGNLLAHIVAMLEQKAGVADTVADAPPLDADDVAFIVGHDTQLGALGGLLNAHWDPGHGLAADDMPPGGALIFELYKGAGNEPRVRLKFATQTLAQFRSEAALPGGVAVVPARFAGCTGDDCSVSLASLAAIARNASSRGFVLKEWTKASDAILAFPPLVDPAWTNCSP